MATPQYNTQTNSNGSDHILKPEVELKEHRPEKDTDNYEETHLHSTIPIQNITELSALWHSELKVKNIDNTSAIGPLGLLGFGLTTFLLNLSNAGVFEVSPVVLAMGVAYGGLAQLIAGIMEWKKGNNFTSVAFCSYGTFWWSFVLIKAIGTWRWIDKTKYDEEDVEKSTAWYLFMWFVFTFVMLIASFTKPWAIRVVFFTLDLLFILLASSDWKNGDKDILKAAGIVGLICAISAIYAGSAEIINGAWGITILPLGAPGEKWLKKAEE